MEGLMGRQGGPRAACGSQTACGKARACDRCVRMEWYCIWRSWVIGVAPALIVVSFAVTFFDATMSIAKLTVFDAQRFHN